MRMIMLLFAAGDILWMERWDLHSSLPATAISNLLHDGFLSPFYESMYAQDLDCLSHGSCSFTCIAMAGMQGSKQNVEQNAGNIFSSRQPTASGTSGSYSQRRGQLL